MKAQLIDIDLKGLRTIQLKRVDAYFLNTPFHFHQLCELVWIEESFGKRIIGDHVGQFEKNDLVLMGPNLPHIWQNDDQFLKKNDSLRVKSTVIYFPADLLQNLSDDESIINSTQTLIKNSSRGLRFYGATLQKAIHYFKSINEETGMKKIIRFLQIIELLSVSTDFEYLASVRYRNYHDKKDTARINAVYQFLIQHFNRDISLAEVASICSMTPSAFSRYFKSRTQKPFISFLNELRIGHACKLLQNDQYTISDVCYECGYNNLTNFNKFFKTISGTTPLQYRKKYQQSQEYRNAGVEQDLQ